MGNILDTAWRVMKDGFGEGIGKAFTSEAMDLGKGAVKADIMGQSKKLINNAMNSGAITREAFETASKAEGFDMINYAKGIAKDNSSKLNSDILTSFKKSSMKYDDFLENRITSFDYLGKSQDKGIGIKNMAKGYFQDPDFGGARTKATIGGAVAGAVGIRYLSGGSLTTNARGEHDIAGIPFI